MIISFCSTLRQSDSFPFHHYSISFPAQSPIHTQKHKSNVEPKPRQIQHRTPWTPLACFLLAPLPKQGRSVPKLSFVSHSESSLALLRGCLPKQTVSFFRSDRLRKKFLRNQKPSLRSFSAPLLFCRTINQLYFPMEYLS